MKIEINIDDRLIERMKTFFMKRNVIITLLLIFMLSIVVVKAANVTLTNFSSGDTISSSAVNANFANLSKAAVPIGTIVAFGGTADKIPEGWLLCDGSEKSNVEYSELYSAIGTSWGNVSGNATTFNLPDLRGIFLRGVSPEDDTVNRQPTGLNGVVEQVDPDKGNRTAIKAGGNTGNNVGSFQGDTIRNITGQVDGGLRGGAVSYSGVFETFYQGEHNGGDSSNGGFRFNASRVVPTGSDNRPKNAYVYYIIRSK